MRLIDGMHMGRARVIGTWVVDDVLIDPGPTSCLEALLEGLGGMQPRALLLTHIHLDHAGGSGSLVERWPELEVYVHELGAKHMVDPSRLFASATQLYDDMEVRWGAFVPVPEERLRILHGGERILSGRFEVAYTPGHAKHHVSYLHGTSETAFVGDVGGVRIASGAAIPPTPPPDIDVEAWHASLETIRAWSPKRLAVTHFGSGDDVDDQLDEVGGLLDAWASFARAHDFSEFDATVESEIIAGGADPETAAAYAQAAPRDQLYSGLRRYLTKAGKLGD